MKIYSILLATLVATAAATDFTCVKPEVAVCCKARTDDVSACTAAEVEDDGSSDGTNIPTYYCNSRRFARCCDSEASAAAATNVYKTIVIGPQTGVLSYAFTLTAKGPTSTAAAAPGITGVTSPATAARKCKDIASDRTGPKRRHRL